MAPTPTTKDPLQELEIGIWNLHRTAGALRAVRSLTQEEEYSEDEAAELGTVRRCDLAHLLDALASDLVAQLDALEGHMHVLQGYQSRANDDIDRIRRG